MTSLIDILPTVQLLTEILPRKSSSKASVIIDDHNKLFDQLSIRYDQSHLIHSDVRFGDLVVLYFGQTDSSLRTALNDYFKTEDITLILFSTEEQLWSWLNTNSSLRVASLVIQANINIQEIASRSHEYKNIRSILIRCRSNELISLQRFSRSHIKIDGTYDDDTRILIKLVIDLAHLSEELGDQQREEENNELSAQRHYDRALKLCALARKL